MVVVRTQNFVSLAARGSGPLGSGTNAKFSEFQPRVVVLRTQNFLSPAARGSGTRGSVGVVVVRTQNFLSPEARGCGTNAKFSKFSRVW